MGLWTFAVIAAGVAGCSTGPYDDVETRFALQIPRRAVTFCSETCFGSSRWDANLLLAEAEVEISIPNSKEVIDWCWQPRIPIGSAEARRKWIQPSGEIHGWCSGSVGIRG
jgi:hypothetical protein